MDMEDGEGEGGPGKLSGGTGLGDGEGQKDVSEKIENQVIQFNHIQHFLPLLFKYTSRGKTMSLCSSCHNEIYHLFSGPT